MPIGINFEKARAESLIAALDEGKAVSPAGDRWTIDEMLALAGACFFAAMSHGALIWRGQDQSTWDTLPLERREAEADSLVKDMHAAVEFYAKLHELVRDGEFDEQFEAHMRAIVSSGGADRPLTVVPTEGLLGVQPKTRQ